MRSKMQWNTTISILTATTVISCCRAFTQYKAMTRTLYLVQSCNKMASSQYCYINIMKDIHMININIFKNYEFTIKVCLTCD